MRRFRLHLGVFWLLVSPLAAAGAGRIVGQVVDAQQHIPLEYASVLLYRLPDSTQVTGAATDARGRFELSGLRPGRYFLTVDFLGYRERTLGPVHLSPETLFLDLGTIPLEATVLSTEPVEVTAEAPPVTFKLDKKVVRVSRQAAAGASSALEVLETVPSVTVDLEGQVYLRGSNNFTLLIDGRPTLMDPSEALAQIPASLIDRIEIITSPSARYDPEGEVGIMNVVLKKQRRPGVSGALNLYAGRFTTYGGDLLLNRRSGPVNLYLSGAFHRRAYPGHYTGYEWRETLALERSAEGTYERRMTPYNLRGGIELSLGSTFLSLGGSYGRWQMLRSFDLSYQESRTDSAGTRETQYTTEDSWQRSSPYSTLFATFQRRFQGQEHRLEAEIQYTHRTADEASYTLRTQGDTPDQGSRSTEESSIGHWSTRLEYRRPLTAGLRLDLGYQGKGTRNRTLKTYASYDTLQGDFVPQPQFQHDLRFLREHHALYGLLAADRGVWGMQLGLRLETTYRRIFLAEGGDTFRLYRWDLFPSFHLSYQFPGHRQVQFGYSRRIRRPRSWWLEPYPTWLDPNNVHQGNPNLKPAYTHSVELSLQAPLGPALATLELYGRRTYNRIERVQEAYNDTVLLHTYANVDASESVGGDLTIDATLWQIWNLRVSADFYRYRLQQEDNTRTSWNSSVRFRNEFRFGRRHRGQINLWYRSPSVTSQGTRQGFFTVDLAWKVQFSRQLSLTLRVRDLFSTGRWAFDSEGTGFQVSRTYQRTSPTVSLSLRYLFNNYRPKRTRPPADEENDMGGEEMDLF